MAVALTGIELVKDKINRRDFFNDYQELTRILYEENLELKNSSFSANHDITDKSYRAAARSDNERSGTSKNNKKTTYFGVVIGKLEGGGFWKKNYTYYIDVPLWNKKLIDHPETFQNNYISDEVKLKQFEDLIFIDRTPSSFFDQELDINCVVEVNLPQNYPNHIQTNKAECYIINNLGKAVNGRKDAPRNTTGGGVGGAFEAENRAASGGGTVPAGGAPGAGSAFSQLPEWAVTVRNSGLNAYSGMELKQINDASRSISEVVVNMPQYTRKIATICQHFGVDPRLIYAIAAVETKFNHGTSDGRVITSSTGAGGLMQLTSIAITDSITRGNVQNISQVKAIIGNTKLLYTKKDGSKYATPALVKLAKTNLDLNIWIGVNTWVWSVRDARSSGPTLNLKAAAGYNGGFGKWKDQDNTGVRTFNFSRIRKESQNYIFRFNAFLNLLPASQGAPPAA